MQEKQDSKRLFLLYLVIGGFATVVDFAVLYALTEFAGMFYLVSASISYLVGMLTNYSLNKVYNFKNKSKEVFKQFGLFAIVALIGLAINNIILYFLVQYFGVWYIAAKVVSVAVVMFWSFFGHKHITFKLLQ